MRDALLGIMAAYSDWMGTSKIMLLFVISMIAVILIDENTTTDDERRRLNPTVFLLSLWSGISYTLVLLLLKNNESKESETKKKTGIVIVGGLFAIAAIALSGQFVFYEQAIKLSIYEGSGVATYAGAVICILIYFLIYYCLSRQLFTANVERSLFMIFVVFLHLFGFYSEKAATVSLFLNPFSIGAVVIHAIMPLILLGYIVKEEKIKAFLAEPEESEGTVSEEDEEYLEEWDMKKHKILNIRNMAIAFVALFVLFAATVFVLNSKINSLYGATVALEEAANTKMSVYELNGADGNVLLTMMISPDGTVTAIDGGGREEAESCEDFIRKYTDKIDKWYIYSEESKDKGARDYCDENGIDIVETFVVSGVEKID